MGCRSFCCAVGGDFHTFDHIVSHWIQTVRVHKFIDDVVFSLSQQDIRLLVLVVGTARGAVRRFDAVFSAAVEQDIREGVAGGVLEFDIARRNPGSLLLSYFDDRKLIICFQY